MLEPWRPSIDLGGPYRGLVIRQGFDLEPSLPDPAPAYLNPEGALHPALVEPLPALPFHSFPTSAARSALVARVLSAPGRAQLSDSSDPFLGVYRFALKQGMEAEVRGCLALVLIRGLIAEQRKGHRTFRPSPEVAAEDPSYDPFARRRARLHSGDWDHLWQEIDRAAAQVGRDPALAFERATLLSSAGWLRDYRAWWEIADLLGEAEQLPEDVGEIRSRLECFPLNLKDAIAAGVAAEEEFMASALGRPEGVVDANWILSQQLRSLRNLELATRSYSLELHELVRRCDVARVRVQLAYRATLLRYWTAEDPVAMENEILAIPDPDHATTLGAGLGRVLGVVLLARLRRGEDKDAVALAERALRLAPEELSVRIASNDLRFHFGERDAALLRSLKEERTRWDSVSVCLMGARVATRLGDKSTSRHFTSQLFKSALNLQSVGGWAVGATEVLQSAPGPARRALAGHLSQVKLDKDADDPLLHILFGPSGHNEALEDLELALLDACLDDDALEGLTGSRLEGSRKRKNTPAWKQLLTKSLVPADHPEFCSRLWSRISAIRAANETIRQPPLAAEVRALQNLLSRAAELKISAPAPLADLLPRLGSHLHAPSQPSAETLSSWIREQRDPLRVLLRGPRSKELSQELSVIASQARLAEREDILDSISRLRARIADPSSDLDSVDEALSELHSRFSEPTQAMEAHTRTQGELMGFHPDFDRFSTEELGIRADALRRARRLVKLFNLSGGQRDRKRLKGEGARDLFELRHRTSSVGGLRVFYRRDGASWLALAAMSKYDDRQQQEAIERVARSFVTDS